MTPQEIADAQVAAQMRALGYTLVDGVWKTRAQYAKYVADAAAARDVETLPPLVTHTDTFTPLPVIAPPPLVTLPPPIVAPPSVADDIPIVPEVTDDTAPVPASQTIFLLPAPPVSPIDDEWFNTTPPDAEETTLSSTESSNQTDAGGTGGEIPPTLRESEDEWFRGNAPQKKAPGKKSVTKKRHQKSSARRKPKPKKRPTKKAIKKQRTKKRQSGWELAA